MIGKWERFVNRVMNFLSSLPERDQYISEQSRRYWLLREQVENLERQ